MSFDQNRRESLDGGEPLGRFAPEGFQGGVPAPPWPPEDRDGSGSAACPEGGARDRANAPLCSYMELSRDKPINTGLADEGTSPISGMYNRLERLGTAKRRGDAMGSWISQDSQEIRNQYIRQRQNKIGREVRECGTHLVFRHYLASDVVRLAQVHTCKKHLLCPVCAILRAGKSLRRYVEAIQASVLAGDEPYLVTHTVKNSEELRERSRHILSAYRKMVNFRKDYRRYGRGDGWQLAGVEGGLYSLEVKRGAAGGWHPHIHALWLLPPGKRLSVDDLRQLWLKVTKDSHVFNVKPITDQGDGIVSGCLEVLKYALKFSDLSFSDNWHASQELKGMRLTSSFGTLYGIKEEEAGADEIEEGDEPYIEYVARWIGSRYLVQAPTTHGVAPTGEARAARGATPEVV